MDEKWLIRGWTLGKLCFFNGKMGIKLSMIAYMCTGRRIKNFCKVSGKKGLVLRRIRSEYLNEIMEIDFMYLFSCISRWIIKRKMIEK